MEKQRANVVDVVAKALFYGEVSIDNGRIVAIDVLGDVQPSQPYLLPGFVDAHVHIESSMLMPDEFAFAALEKGTLASVSDPHEIANVLGAEGLQLMQRRSALTPFKILFGAPSCVPATPFETAGAAVNAQDIHQLFASGDAGYLSEVMNFPGVLNNDPELMKKIAAAKAMGLPIDGHAPGLKGDAAAKYASAGITTDHECTSLQEAHDKLAAGMSILIREGSAAKDFPVLHPLLSSHPDAVMLCSDDKHPDDLLEDHIREQVKSALLLGHSLFNVLRAATFNPVTHYGISLGLLQVGDAFDAILVRDLNDFHIISAWIEGKQVVENEVCLLPHHPPECLNHFMAEAVTVETLRLPHPGLLCRVIVAQDGQLLTRQQIAPMPEKNGMVEADLENDVLFLTVINRYHSAPPVVALVKGFGLSDGAIASSVAHDSHNIVAVGTSPEWLEKAVNEVIRHKGGLAAASPSGLDSLPLPVAGLMSDRPADIVGPAYRRLNECAQQMGSSLHAPFMTLSFMALLVIPELKLSDKGLFDGNRFEFCSLGVEENEVSEPAMSKQ